jgi:hypothetical protein
MYTFVLSKQALINLKTYSRFMSQIIKFTETGDHIFFAIVSM